MKNAKEADVIYSDESFLAFWPSSIAAHFLKKKLVWCIFELGFVQRPKYKFGLGLFFTYINKLFAKNVHAATTINKDLENIIKNRYMIKNVKTILPGFDFDRFKDPDCWEVRKKYNLYNKKVLLIVGAIHPIKGSDTAIKILKKVKKEFPDTVLLFVGEGKVRFIQTLANLASKLNLQNDIIFTGVVPETKLKDYFYSSDMVLLCGKIVGFTVLEAISVGRMPIYSVTGKPLGSTFMSLGIGLNLEKNNESEYAKRIIDYLSNQKKYESKLEKDKIKIEKKFSKHRLTEDVNSFFNNL